jgi:DTW domain-containing protein YfiP
LIGLRIDPSEYSREQRCPGCRLIPSLCICDELPDIDIPFELTIVQHPKERTSLSNTGSLAARILRPSKIVGPDGEGLESPGHLLFPQPAARPLTEADLDGMQRLVILDATWRQARKYYRKMDALRPLRCVTIPPGTQSKWILRQPPEEGRLSTIEAICAALDALGLTKQSAEVRAVLDVFMPRMMHLTRRISLDQLRNGGCTPDGPG